MLCSDVVIYFKLKICAPGVRTIGQFQCSRNGPPACPNADGHPVAMKVVSLLPAKSHQIRAKNDTNTPV